MDVSAAIRVFILTFFGLIFILTPFVEQYNLIKKTSLIVGTLLISLGLAIMTHITKRKD